MADSTTVYLIPGMKIKIKALSVFVSPGPFMYKNAAGESVSKTLTNGFFVVNEDVGSIAKVDGAPAITYTHKKFSQNKIIFVSKTKDIGVIDVLSVPIHDHSSIITGGPAYGTYFADDEVSSGD